MFLFSLFFLCPCLAINVSVQYNGGLLPDIILSTQWLYHAMKKFCIGSLLIWFGGSVYLGTTAGFVLNQSM